MSKFKRFRKEWFYSGILAFLTTCLIALILCTFVIISNAEEVNTSESIINEDDLVIKDDIISDLESVDLNINDYGYCFGNGYSDSYSDNIYNPSLTYLSNYLNGRSYSCYNREYDFDEQETVYNRSIEDIVFTSEDILNAPYLVQVSSGGTYMYKFFFIPLPDIDGSFNGFGTLNNLKIFNRYVFLPNNSICLDVYMSDNETVSSVSVNSICVNVSGYSSFIYDDDEKVIDFVTYDRVPGGYDVVATNISIIGLKINDIYNDYGLPDGSSLFNDSDMTASMKLFYKNIGLDVSVPTKVQFMPWNGGNESDSTYEDGSGGDDTNNMYMRTADWQFNIPKYWGNVTSTVVKPEYTSNWGKGNITFYGLINDYQEDNSSHFNIVFNFYVLVQGHRFSDVNSEINQNFQKSFALRSYSVPLSDFINNNNSVNFTVSDLFNRCKSSDNINVNDFIEPIKSYNSIDKWKWTISCDAQLSAGNYVSGSIQETYNFISQVSKEDSNTITENHNPYQPDPDNPDIDDDDDNNDNDDNNDGKGCRLINNDNDNITINHDTSKTTDYLDNLVPNTDGSGGLTERFVNLTNSNQWFQVMSTALPWIGTQFWADVGVILHVMLGIVACAFVLWVFVHII